MKTSVAITLDTFETVDGTEQVLNMCENCGAPVDAIPVPAGTYLEIDDFDAASGGTPGKFRLQQTNDGTSWFTIGCIETFGIGKGVSLQVNPDTPWRIDGGPNVAFRIAILTPNGPTKVACVANGYRVS